MGSVRIRDIRERQDSATIEVRVLKRWISKGKKEELCYQFVDIYGDGIEATAHVKDVEHFDSLIRLQSCYKVSNYICTGPRTYMATVQHVASLVIGQKAVFEPITNVDIPTVYFNFATYKTIKGRIKDSKVLTDFIGRVEKNSLRSTRSSMQLRKTMLTDDMGNHVEITLWPDKQHLIGDEVVAGHIVAITSTTVTEYNGRLQLESTHLTTVVINPDMPQTMEQSRRLRELSELPSAEAEQPTTTLLELKLNSQQNFQGSKNFICNAKIAHIHEDRAWYYVFCSKCSDKVYPVLRNDTLVYVCRDDNDMTPNFRYCVNATISDETGSADVVFFDDSMQEMLNISCKDMVTNHANATNPRIIPNELKAANDRPRRLHLTVKNDGKIVVDSVSKEKAVTQKIGTSTFTPTTPLSKTAPSKRQMPDTPESQKRQK